MAKATIRIMDKDYKLINQANPSQMIIVHRLTQEMGIHRVKPKTEADPWKRSFKVVDANSIARFVGADFITLQHRSNEMPYMVDTDGNTWTCEAIPDEVVAKEVSTKHRGRPKGSKNKEKEVVAITPVVTPVEAVITPVDETVIVAAIEVTSEAITPVEPLTIPATA